jgi:hypothetical protein
MYPDSTLNACWFDHAPHLLYICYTGGDAAERLQVVAGDVTDPGSLSAALKDAAGVIFAASGKGFWSANPVDNAVSRGAVKSRVSEICIPSVVELEG